MHAYSILAFAGAVAAVPFAGQHHQHHQHHKREFVWETITHEAIVTVPVTKTVWLEPGETPPTYEPHSKAPSYSSVEPAAYTPPAPVYSAPSSSSAPAYVAPSSSSSVYVAPVPTSTSSVYVAPVPTSTYVAPTSYEAPTSSYVAPSTYVAPTTSSYVAPAPSSSSAPSYGSGVSGMAAPGTYYTGDLTHYTPGMGSCGIVSGEEEHIVAVSHTIMDAYNPGNPNNNPLCGKKVTITGANGQLYPATIVDTCPGCTESDLDLTESFFNMVTNNGDGRVGGMKWCFD